MKYCTRCVLPDTKPDLFFDKNGVCNACTNFTNRAEVNWDDRKREFLDIVEQNRAKNYSGWDCIVPISGGKDSTYQAWRLLQLGINPLGVIASTCHLSALGRKNIENIKKLGIDVIEFSANPLARKVLNRVGLKEVGDISWPEHLSIFTAPVRIAVKFGISLIIWGENSQHEYGGPAAAIGTNKLDRRWLEEFGGLLGLRVSDLTSYAGIAKKDLIYYTYPNHEEIIKVGVTGLFLGYYFPWDGYTNALISQNLGFTPYQNRIEGSFVNYEKMDNYQGGIHDYFKFLKFGFGRASDLASSHIRRNRISRSDAVPLVRAHDGELPLSYLGKPLNEILDHIEMTVDEFWQICDYHTNKKLFEVEASGQLKKDNKGNLIKLYPLNDTTQTIVKESVVNAASSY